MIASSPIMLTEKGSVAIDPSGAKIAYETASKVVVLDVGSGVAQTVAEIGPSAAQLIWSQDGKQVLVGDSDGRVHVWEEASGNRLLIASPVAESFRASAWPGQPPQGAVLQLALSHDGHRVAVIRQDIATVDIHDLGDGRRLTQLTPPWSTLKIPAQVSFAADDAIVTAWGVHPMARDKPRFVTAHQLPRNFEEALAVATARIAALNQMWSAEGPPAK